MPKTKAARKRSDHPAQCRVNDAELARVNGDIASLQKASPIPISLGAYTKLSILDHFRLSRIEAQLKYLVAGNGIDIAQATPSQIVGQLKDILEGT